MTTQYSDRARNASPPVRDVSIADFSWAAQPKIFGQYVIVQTTPTLKGVTSSHVC
jgi:hypothetical protein